MSGYSDKLQLDSSSITLTHMASGAQPSTIPVTVDTSSKTGDGGDLQQLLPGT